MGLAGESEPGMSDARYVGQHGFGRVARIPTPTPFESLGDINSRLRLVFELAPETLWHI